MPVHTSASLPVRLAILSHSARCCAQMARHEGYAVFTIDTYADADTQQVAEGCVQWDGFHAEDPQAHWPALAQALETFAVDAVIVGSGFEACPALYQQLAQQFPLFANTPLVMRRVKDPSALKAECDQVGVLSPAVSLTPPTQGEWLRKRIGQCGGWHVEAWHAKALHNTALHSTALNTQALNTQARHGETQPAPLSTESANPNAPVYWQRRCAGVAVGLLFLAHKHGVTLIGVHELMHRPNNFVYAGARRSPEPALWQAAEAVLQRLVPQCGLRGLNSIDALWHDASLQVLEVNPRLSASMRLYHALPLISAHLACFEQAHAGRLASAASSLMARMSSLAEQRLGLAPCAMHYIVYARAAITLPTLDLPDWVEDRPTEYHHQAGQPLCSLYAEGPTEYAVETALQQQQDTLKQLWGAYVCEHIEFKRFERSTRQCTTGSSSD